MFITVNIRQKMFVITIKFILATRISINSTACTAWIESCAPLQRYKMAASSHNLFTPMESHLLKGTIVTIIVLTLQLKPAIVMDSCEDIEHSHCQVALWLKLGCKCSNRYSLIMLDEKSSVSWEFDNFGITQDLDYHHFICLGNLYISFCGDLIPVDTLIWPV